MGAAVSASGAPGPTTATSSVIDGEATVLNRAQVLLERIGPTERMRQVLLAMAQGNVLAQRRPIVLVSQSGSGKSTFVAQLVQSIRACPDYDIVHAIFVGAAEGSTSLFRVLQELVARLEADLRAMPSTASDDEDKDDVACSDILGLSASLARLLGKLAACGQRVLIAIDALNELDGEVALRLGWLPHVSNATFLLTTIGRGTGYTSDDACSKAGGECTGSVLDNDSVQTVLTSLHTRFSADVSSPILLGPEVVPGVRESPDPQASLDQADSRLVSTDSGVAQVFWLPDLCTDEQHQLLHQLLGRKLTVEEGSCLAAKRERGSPLYLRLLAHHMTTNQDSNDTRCIDESPGSITEMYDVELDAIARRFPNAGTVLLAVLCSAGGMFREQIAEIADVGTRSCDSGAVNVSEAIAMDLFAMVLRTTPVPSSPLHEYVAFIHMQARDAAARKFAPTMQALADAHSVCAQYFKQQYELLREQQHDADNAVLVRQCLTRLPVHIIGSNNSANARKLLCSPEYCQIKCATGMVAELALDFSAADARFGCDNVDNSGTSDSASIFADFAECVRTNAHILRAHPYSFTQQALNARDSSAACKCAVTACKEASDGQPMLLWRNKSQGKPVCLSTFSAQPILHWAVSCAPSGKLIVTGASDCCLHVLDREGSEVAVLEGHADEVQKVAFHPLSDEFVVSAAPHGSGTSSFDVNLWSTITHDKVATFETGSYVSDLAWSPGGQRIALIETSSSSSGHGRCTVMKVNTTKNGFESIGFWPPGALEDAKHPSCCCFDNSGSGERIVIAAGETLHAFSAEDSNSCIAADPSFARGCHEDKIVSVHSTGAQLIATGGMDARVALWSAVTGECLCDVPCHQDMVQCVRLGPCCSIKSGRKAVHSQHVRQMAMLTCSEDRTICYSTICIDSKGFKGKVQGFEKPKSAKAKRAAKSASMSVSVVQAAILRGHSSAVEGVCFVDDGQCCVSVSDDGSVRCWDLNRAITQDFIPGSSTSISAAVWALGTSNTQCVICADSSANLCAFDAAGLLLLWQKKLPVYVREAVTALSVTRDNYTGAAAMFRRVHLFSTMDGTVLHSLESFADWVNIVSIGAGILAAAGDFAHVSTWSLARVVEGSEATHLTHQAASSSDSVLALAVIETLGTSSATALVSGGNDNRVRVWLDPLAEDAVHTESSELGGWVTSVDATSVDVGAGARMLAATTAGSSGSVVLLRLELFAGKESLRLESVATVQLGITMAWCGFAKDAAVLLTASEMKMIQAWKLSATASATESAVIEQIAIFPGGARFGSPDGVGGQGNVLDNKLCIGDESGRLYCIELVV